MFSHPDIIQILNESYIPVADNCSYTQTQKDAKGEFFRRVAEQGHYGGRIEPTATRQGLYACTSNGELLGSINTRDAAPLLEVLEQSLERWRERSDTGESPDIPESYPVDPRLGWSYPENGLTLKVTVRDLPRDSNGVDSRHNIDFAWFTEVESRALVPDDIRPGQTWRAPGFFTKRLALRHFIDTVRGQSPGWREENLKDGEINLTVESVESDLIRIRMEGRIHLEAEPTFESNPFSGLTVDKPRGLKLDLYGRLAFDPRQRRVEAFDAVATGDRWGFTTYNVRFDDPGPAPIGFAFELGSDNPIERTPPASIGRNYFD
ncbi:MAG: hypothetical protein J4F39_14110 [Candidatus Latescibacteria bacterium]|nr:hypothetical protein [Candidatus Latescibacterota bacterium]